MNFEEALRRIQGLMGVGSIEDDTHILEEDAVKDFIKSNKGTVRQVVENWCLVHYCFLINRDMTLNHWRRELYTQMHNCAKVSFPNNRYPKRYSKFKEIFIDKLNLDNPQEVINLIYNKFFVEEGFKEDTKLLNNIAFDFCNNLNNIIDIIAIGDFSKIKEYAKILK